MNHDGIHPPPYEYENNLENQGVIEMAKVSMQAGRAAQSYWKVRLPLAVALVVVVVAVGWWGGRAVEGDLDERERSGVLLHLKSLLGEQAPSFTLPDSEGQNYSVDPGDGEYHVLIFHMGTI